MIKSAEISPCGLYRYSLTRKWEAWKGTVNFIMLNPSTADAQEDDPTIRRCIGFAKAWGYGGIVVTNLFAYRATNPKELKKVDKPFGEHNHLYQLEAAVISSELTVCAWGAHGLHRKADVLGRQLGYFTDLYCLGLTKDGHPKHPLYLPKSTTPILWISSNGEASQ